MRFLYRYLLVCCVLLNPFISAAQIVYEGHIYEKTTMEPISHVVVTLSDLSGKETIAFKHSDSKGYFRMQVPPSIDTLQLAVSLLGYTSESRLVTAKNQQFRFELSVKEFQLREVHVKPPDIWKRGDTLNYNVLELKGAQDRTISDLLKKLPGIEVNKGGGILYNGKPINKFYIEGLDLLAEKYAIATNNVPVDAVSNVQVIENHQYVKALDGIIPSDQAAINLKLKDGKMSRPVGTAKIGAGFSPFLWNLDLFALQAAKKRQTLVMYKTNNTGHDITKDLNSYTLDFGDLLAGHDPIPPDLLHAGSLQSLDLDEKRHLFNRTHVLTLNNLWKLNDDSQLRVNINYLNDKRDQHLWQYSGYYLPQADSTLAIEENSYTDISTNQLETNLTYTNNAPGTYLNNSLKFSGRWRNAISGITGTNQVDQRFNVPLFYLLNDLSLVKNRGKKVFRFDSFTRYSTLPQQLHVMTDTLIDPYSQDITRSTFYTNNKTSFGFSKELYSLFLDLQLTAKAEAFDSETDFHPVADEGTHNKIKSGNLILYLGPRFIYKKNNFTWTTRLPLSSNNLILKNNSSDFRKNYYFFFVEPSTSLMNKFGPFWTTTLSFRHKNDIGDILDFPLSYYMTNYRSLRKGSGVLSKRNSQNYSLRAAYRNQIEALFFNFSVSYLRSSSNLLNNTSFKNSTSLISPTEFDNKRNNWYFTGYIAKYIDGLKTNLSLSGNYTLMKIERLQQQVKIPLTSGTLFLQPKIDVKVNKQMNIAYSAEFINSRSKMNNLKQKTSSSINQVGQHLKFYFFPSSRWQLNMQFEHLYSEITDNLSSNLFFMDIGIRYVTKDWEYSLDWTNIFNKKNYAYTVDNGLSTFSSNYRLNPYHVIASVSFRF